jgi:MFS family permease
VSARVGDGLPEALPEVLPDIAPPSGKTGELLLDRVGWSALRYSPFRRFIASMLQSTTGNFIFIAALGWYVVELTGSAAATGLAFTVFGAPVLLLTAQAGVLTDRFGSRTMMTISVTAMGIAGLAIAALAVVPDAPFPLVLLLAFAMGVAQTIGAPAALAIVSDLVPPPAVSSAVALNFLHMSIARIIGGLIGGLILAATSSAVAFAITGALNLLPALIIARLPGPAQPPRTRHASSIIEPLREAVAYGRRFPTLGALLLLPMAAGLLGLSYIFMLPVAAEELGIGAGGLGTLLAASGTGGLIAGLVLERVQRRIGHGRAFVGGLLVTSVSLIAFGFAPGIVVAAIALAVVGGSILTYASADVTLISALSPAHLRGRMVGLFALVYWGMMPVGAAVLGFIAEATSAQTAVLCGGLGLGLATIAVVIVRPQIATLAVTRDGESMTGDLRGSGREAAVPAPLEG